MLNFESPKISDKQWFDKIAKEQNVYNSDNAFATAYMWNKNYKTKICKYNNFILEQYIKLQDNTVWYSFPTGSGDYKNVLNMLIAHTKEAANEPLNMIMTKEEKECLEQLMPGEFIYKEDRDSAEYVYLRENLANLQGRKYHGKRNHISKFKRLYNWTYEDITTKNLNEAVVVAKKWCEEFGCTKDGKGLSSEHCAFLNTINHYKELEMRGGLIKIDGNPVAMTMGSELSKDIFDINFEKALPGYDGLYAAINNFFATSLLEYKYLNREDDMGLEGLRKAKLSYKPEFLIEKYLAKMI